MWIKANTYVFVSFEFAPRIIYSAECHATHAGNELVGVSLSRPSACDYIQMHFDAVCVCVCSEYARRLDKWLPGPATNILVARPL